MKLLKPLHNLFLIIAAVFFIIAFFTLRKTLDIHIHDTMYVITFARVFMLSAVYLSLFWLLYCFTGRFMFSRKLYNVHIIGTVILFILILIAALWSNPIIESYTKNNSFQKQRLSIEAGQLIVIALLTLTSLQLLYPLNLIIGLLKNKKH